VLQAMQLDFSHSSSTISVRRITILEKQSAGARKPGGWHTIGRQLCVMSVLSIRVSSVGPSLAVGIDVDWHAAE